MRPFMLRHKLIVGVFGIILIFALVIVVFIKSLLTQKLEAEMQHEGVFLAEHMAAMCVDKLLTEKHMQLQLMINNFISETAHIEYVFLQDPDGKLIAHTFEKGFPALLQQANVLKDGQRYKLQSLLFDGKKHIDIAAPILRGQLGHFHLGFSEGFIHVIVTDTIRLTVMTIAGFLVATCLIALVFVKKITNPLHDLVKTAQDVGSGDLKKRVRVVTNDEIGWLGTAFNRMLDELQQTTVSRDYVDNVLQRMHDALVVVTPVGVIESVNRATCDLVEYAEEDLVGQPFSFVFEDGNGEDDGAEKIISLAESVHVQLINCEAFLKSRGGEKISVLLSGAAIRDKADNVEAIVFTAKDISRLKRAEMALRESEEQFRMIAETSNDMIHLNDMDGRILFANPATERLLGYPLEEVVNSKAFKFIHPDDLEKMRHNIESTLERGKPPSLEMRLLKKDGAVLEVEVSGFVITLADDRKYMGAILRDITDRKKTERQLAQAYEEARFLTDELQIKNKKIERNSREMEKALEEISSLIRQITLEGKFGVYYSHPDLKRCWEVLSCGQEECPCFGKAPLRCWQIEGTQCRNEIQGSFEEKYDDCLGCEYYKVSTEDPILQIGEQFNNMVYVLEKNHWALQDAFEKLKQSQATILQQEKMASVGQLAAGVAHEINNPVGFIMSNMGSLKKYIDRLKDFIIAQTEASDPVLSPVSRDELKALRKKLKVDFVLGDSADLIKECLEGVDRVKEIVQNLKSFSRVDQAETKEADINECLDSTLKIVWNELKYKCEVVKEYGELPFTDCNPQQLNQVFVNLLVNAAHAIEERGVITVKSWSEKKNIFVSISDTGNGITKENLSRLFEPFFTTKEVGKGTGLGLSIAYDIVTEKHKGELLVESVVGRGTTFTVKIPVIKRGKNE